MNYLAHLHLSFNQQDLMIGNFIADFVKGREASKKFPVLIQRGITLHHKIDAFTDAHHVVKSSKRRLYDTYHKYAAVIVDIYYDYLLANNWELYSTVTLGEFANSAYSIMLENWDVLPNKLTLRLKSMIDHNWLVGYQSMEALQFTFDRMADRARFESKMEKAPNDLVKHLDAFNDEFNTFYPQLYQFAGNCAEDLGFSVTV